MASTLTVDKIKGGSSGVALTLPTTDGSAGQLLKTNGSAVLSWATDVDTGITSVASDTTPQLGGDLDINGNSIVSVTNGNILITPNGTGDVILDGLKYPQADGTAGYVLKTDGSAQLSWVAQTTDTNTTDLASDTTPQLGADLDVNSKSIVSVTNGNILITPNGTGEVIITRPEVKDYSETVQAISGSFTVNATTLNSGNVIHHSSGGTVSFDTPSSSYAGVSLTLICQSAPTISGSNVVWNAATPPSPSGVCVYTFFCGITSGSTYKWFGIEAGKDFA